MAYQYLELQGDVLLRKVAVDLFYDLVIVIPHTGELPVKVVEPGEVLGRRGVAFIDAQLSSEKAREDEFGHIPTESRLGKHLPEACVLLVVEPEAVDVTLGIGGLRPASFVLCHDVVFIRFATSEQEPARRLRRPGFFVARKGFRATKKQLAIGTCR